MDQENKVTLHTEGHCPEHNEVVEIAVDFQELHIPDDPYPTLKKLGFTCAHASAGNCRNPSACPIYEKA